MCGVQSECEPIRQKWQERKGERERKEGGTLFYTAETRSFVVPSHTTILQSVRGVVKIQKSRGKKKEKN